MQVRVPNHLTKPAEIVHDTAACRLEDQEILMLSLRLLQISLVYVNTLMILKTAVACGLRSSPTPKRCHPERAKRVESLP